MDDGYFPEGGGASFTDAEWKRAKENIEKLREKLAKTCKHLIKSKESPRPRRVDWDKIRAARERLAEKERDALRAAQGFED